jgi:transcriptional regulator with XRE-family HTH domain
MVDMANIEELLTGKPLNYTKEHFILDPSWKEYFAERGITQARLALFLAVSRVTLNLWLNGRVPVPGRRMDQLRELQTEILRREIDGQKVGSPNPKKKKAIVVPINAKK